ncbi:hypothetical protein [Streptomyces sp. NRRL F-5135]|uniref:hypothetical protein n=1 Tax=Streptomyces sp. NRRL F-5135 TaxID=1463858 RepID=UPI0004C6BB25|nr:hypothetical protein [Streptomyces sp. NRRL F-5135]
MSDAHGENPEERDTAVPRDPPDQQATAGPDPLDIESPGEREEQRGDDTAEEELPDADESGAGPRGRPRTGQAHPEQQPVPDESPG